MNKPEIEKTAEWPQIMKLRQLVRTAQVDEESAKIGHNEAKAKTKAAQGELEQLLDDIANGASFDFNDDDESEDDNGSKD